MLLVVICCDVFENGNLIILNSKIFIFIRVVWIDCRLG